MTDTRARGVYRWMLRVLPADVRLATGPSLEDAAMACLARERARWGRPGVAFAWLRLAADAVGSAVAFRRAAVSRAHGASLRPQPRSLGEIAMDTLRSDLRTALRQLRRQPGFTIVSVLTLALGIGANTAIFSVVNTVLLRELPYPEPAQLQLITSQFTQQGFSHFWLSTPEYVEFRDHNHSFSSVGAYSIGAANIGASAPTRPVTATVSADFFSTLRVPPAAGRWFNDGDSQPGADPVAILSTELWRRAFGAEPSTLGSRVMIDGVSTLVVGIMPPGFDIHDQKVELWQPLPIDPSQFRNNSGSHFLYLVGRLKPGQTPALARADFPRLYQEWPSYVVSGDQHLVSRDRHPLQLDPLRDDIIGTIQRSLVVLQAAVLLVLVIACANLASLLLARADAREREFAVRSALGAGRARLFVQFVIEGLVLATIGALAGVALTVVALRSLIALGTDAIPMAASIGIDWRVMAFTLALTALTGLVFGLAPLVHLRPGVSSALRDGVRTSRSGGRRLRSGLVIAEVALAVTLTTGAGLLIRSFINLMNVNPGFDRTHLVTFGVVPPVLGSPRTPEERIARRQRFVDLFEAMRTRLRALPGVESATGLSDLPPNVQLLANDTDFEWIPNGKPGQPPDPKYPIQNVDYWQYVTLGFVETLHVPVIKGRDFAPSDVGGAPVVLVNQALVHKFFSDRDPIGQRLKPGFGDNLPWFTVVGVLADMKQAGLDAPSGTEIILLEDQLPRFTFITTQMNFAIRTTAPLSTLNGPIRQIVHDMDPTLPVVKLQTMDETFGDAVARPRFLTLLLGGFAALAVVLAAVGTYGILSFLVGARQQEIGIRMALGADRRRILRQFLTSGGLLALTGLAIGVGAALALTRLMRTLLFEVAPSDPTTIATVAVVIFVVAFAACLLPAFRATRVEPLVVLRNT